MSTNRQLAPGQRIRDAVLRLPTAPAARNANSTTPGKLRREADLPLEPREWSVQAALAALFSFEFVFVLFLFAGRIKANPHLAWVPVDLTALLFVLSVVVGAFVVLTKKVNRYGFVIAAAMAAFVTWLIVSRLWTPSVIYAHQKSLYSVLALWACAGAAVIIASDRARVRRFLTLVVLLSVWFAIEGVIAYATAETRWFVEISGTGYHGLSDAAGCGAVIALATLISLRRRAAFKVMLAAVFALFFFIILISGARQPLLGLAGAVVLVAVIGFRPAPGGIAFKRFQRAAWGILLAAIVVAVALIISGTMTQTLHRFETLLVAEGGGRSAAERQEVWAKAIEFWARAPILGHGVGSFPVLENWITDEKRHPHNVFLETLSELGLVGFVLFAAFLLLALRCVTLLRLREDPLFQCVFLLALFQFSAAMLGPDLSEHRLIYAVLGLLALPEPQRMPRSLIPTTAPPQPARKSVRLRPRHPQQQL